MLIDERDRPANTNANANSSGSGKQFSREVFGGPVVQVAKAVGAVSLVPPYVAEDEEDSEDGEEDAEGCVLEEKGGARAKDLDTEDAVESEGSDEGSGEVYLSQDEGEGQQQEEEESDDEEVRETKAKALWASEVEIEKLGLVPRWRLDDID